MSSTRTLWSPAQIRFVVLAAGLGGVLIAVSWLGAANSTDVHTQLGWLVLAVAAMLLPVGGGAALVIWAHRRIALRHRRAQRARRPLTSRPAPSIVDAAWYAVRNTVRAHHRGCQLLAGKHIERLPGTPEAAGRVPCELCG